MSSFFSSFRSVAGKEFLLSCRSLPYLIAYFTLYKPFSFVSRLLSRILHRRSEKRPMFTFFFVQFTLERGSLISYVWSPGPQPVTLFLKCCKTCRSMLAGETSTLEAGLTFYSLAIPVWVLLPSHESNVTSTSYYSCHDLLPET